mgnify:CR=1 FL=1
MRVFKFGGASVKDANSIKNMASILQNYKNEKPLVVVSAMGKTTNALEGLVKSYYKRANDCEQQLASLKDFHYEIISELFEEENQILLDDINNLFVEIEWALEDEPRPDFGFEYDQMVAIGEMLSTKIISTYLSHCGIDNRWLDVRDVLKTDNNHRNANVDWEQTTRMIQRQLKDSDRLVITQGFIGCTSENFTTTLGREGSDYTAAIFSSVLEAEELVVWKDVPGVLNADPRYFNDTVKLDKITFQEAIELAYYGASVIHPKTIQPLKRKEIPLQVRSFVAPEAPGTYVGLDREIKPLIPFFIVKKDQFLISVSAKDFSFIVENNMSLIFALFSKHKVKVNLVQNSAISCTLSVDNDEMKLPGLIEELKEKFTVLYNDGLTLYTIRHYDDAAIEKIVSGKELILEQRNRSTMQLVLK